MTLRNAFADLATDDSVGMLRRIFNLLKPLGIVTGGGSNRLSVDVNSVTGAVSSVTTVTTVTTVSTVSNQTNMGGVAAFELMKDMSRMAYNSGVRANLT